VKKVTGKLTPEERQWANDLAEDWNENGLPKDVQAKYALLLPTCLLLNSYSQKARKKVGLHRLGYDRAAAADNGSPRLHVHWLP
jgi:hypothetical protein